MENNELGLILVLLCLGSGFAGMILQKTYRAFSYLGQEPPEAGLYPKDGEGFYLSNSGSGFYYFLFDQPLNLSPTQEVCVGLLICFFVFSLSLILICLGIVCTLDLIEIIKSYLQTGTIVPLLPKSLKVCLGFGLITMGGLISYHFIKLIKSEYRSHRQELSLRPIPDCFRCHYYGHEPDLIVCALHPRGPAESHCVDFTQQHERT